MTIAASLSLRAERLRRTPWPELIGHAWLVLVGGMFLWLALRLILPAQLAHALRPLCLAAPLLPLIAKDLSHLPDAIARSRDAIRLRAWGRLPAAWLPPGLLGLLRLDRALRHGFIGWLLRRPRPAQPDGRTFTCLEHASYRTACAIVLLSTLVELPLDAALVPLLIADDSKRMAIHLLILAGALSTLFYMLGDRWLLGDGRHVLAEEGLHLRIGARTHGLVPMQAIAACERIDEPAALWLRRHGLNACDALTASPLDKPNTVLILKPNSRVRLMHLGVERSELACLFLYLDRPDELVRALRAPQ
jgi:hypothetical protein